MLEGLKRSWWLALAALIAGLELVLAGGIWIDKLTTDTIVLYDGVVAELPGEALLVWGDILLTSVSALAAVAIIAGLYLRNSQPDRSRLLIVGGLLPAVVVGAVFFWFPPFWIVSGAAIAVVARASRGPMRAALTA